MLDETAIRAIVRDEITAVVRQLFGGLEEKPGNNQWYSTAEAWKKLGLPNAQTLREMRLNGVFELGKHYRKSNRNPEARNPRWQFNLPACQARLQENPAKYLRSKSKSNTVAATVDQSGKPRRTA
jgi:hypothetical protein